jgi:small subunit ribosomal protein S14
MAKKSMIAKAKRKPKFGVRGYTRCNRCGRPAIGVPQVHAVPVCFRELAHRGELPGIRKASW